MSNSKDGWKKYQKLLLEGWNSRGRGRGVCKKLKILTAGRVVWLLSCFFLFLSNHENYSIKNICVSSKSKIQTKVSSNQNLEHFKMINRRLLVHPYSSSWAIFISLHQEPTFLRLSICAFRFYQFFD